MLPLLLLPLLWGGSLQQQQPGHGIQMQETVSMQEGGCTNVPCSFPSAWTSLYQPVYIYIYRDRSGHHPQDPELVATNVPNIPVNGETQGRFLLMDSRTNNCSLSIRDSRKSDAGIYVLQVYYHHNNYQEKKLTLQVTDLTQKPNIHIQGPLESGHPTRLTCSLPRSCKEGSPLIFSWMGDALDSLNPKTLRSSTVTFTPKPSDDGTKVTCLVTLVGPGVTTQKTIRLNVSYAPQNLTIDMSFRNVTALKILQTTSLPILEGETLWLLCVADSNPPAQLRWFRGSPALNTHPISSTAILELPRVGAGEEGQFTCQAQHPLGSQSISLNLSVVYAPQLLGLSCSWEDQSLNCSCSYRAQPASLPPRCVGCWRLGEKLLEGNHSNTSYIITSSSSGPWANSSLSLRAGLSAQLSAGLRVKAHRKRTARGRKVTNDEDPVRGMVTWMSDQNPQPDRPPDQLSPMEDASPSGEEQDTQYANLTFHGRKLCEAHDKEATSTCIYSEIKKTSQ